MAAFDHSYGINNRVALPTISGYTGAIAGTCRVIGGNLLISGEFGYRSATKRSLAITAIRATKKPPTSHGVAIASWKLQHVPRSSKIVAQEFGPDGSFAYAVQRSSGASRHRVTVFRVLANGHRDRRFGNGGVVHFNIAGTRIPDADAVRLLVGANGKVMVLLETKSQTIITRLRSSGKIDTTWGDDGRVTLGAGGDWGPLRIVDSASLLATGGLLIARWTDSPTTGPELVRFTASGKLDMSFAGSGSWSPPAPTAGGPYARTGYVARTLPLEGGNYLVVFADLAESEVGTGYSLRQAVVEPATGAIVALRTNAGHYEAGGDGGFPDAYPWRAVERKGGPVFGHAQTFSDYTVGTFLGEAWGFGAPFPAPGVHTRLNTNVTSISDFAGSPRFKRVFACGAEGKTSTHRGHLVERGLRKQIAIRQLAV